ncbi:hypothetical protein, partial [Oceanithermus desulfurans]
MKLKTTALTLALLALGEWGARGGGGGGGGKATPTLERRNEWPRGKRRWGNTGPPREDPTPPPGGPV